MSEKMILVEIPERVIADRFLNLCGQMMIFPWDNPETRGYWHMVKAQHNMNRDGLIFTLEQNGVELKRTEVPFTLLFGWFDRLLELAEKGAGRDPTP